MTELSLQSIDHTIEGFLFNLQVLDRRSVLRVHPEAATSHVNVSLDLPLISICFSCDLLHSLSQIDESLAHLEDRDRSTVSVVLLLCVCACV